MSNRRHNVVHLTNERGFRGAGFSEPGGGIGKGQNLGPNLEHVIVWKCWLCLGIENLEHVIVLKYTLCLGIGYVHPKVW